MTRKRKITASVESSAYIYAEIKSNPVKVSFGYDEDSIIEEIMTMDRDALEKLYLSVVRKYYKTFANEYKGYTAQHLQRDVEKHIDRHSERDILDTLVYLVSEGAIVPTKKASRNAVSSSRKIRCASDLTDKQAQALIQLSEFAANVIKRTERDYGKKLSQSGWSRVMNYTEDLIKNPLTYRGKVTTPDIPAIKMQIESFIYLTYEEDTGISGIYESTKINQRKVECNMKKRFSVRASTAAKRRNRVCASDGEYPYLYVLKHGYGPGTLPKNVEVGRVEDYKGYTLVWLNRFLTTSELRDYDIPAETQLERYLGDDLERFMPMPKTKRYTGNFISMSAKMRNRVSASKRMIQSIKCADETYWSDGKWSIYKDGSEIVISNGYFTDYAEFTDDGDVRVAGYTPEMRVPKSVERKLQSLVRSGKIKRPAKWYDDVYSASSKSIECADNFDTLRDRDITSADDVTELVLYITNDSDLYHNRALPIIENLKRKAKRGNYDDELAVKAWMYLADDGVRKYDREFGSGKGSLTLLNKPTREAIARELRDHYKEQVFEGIEAAEDIYCTQDVSKDDVRELVLFITNEQSLYNQAKSIIDNMKRKIRSGKYDEARAVDAWMYLADAGTKLYDKRYGSGKGSLTFLNKSTRRAVAEELKDYFNEEVFEDVDAATDIYCSDNSDLTVNLDALELGEPYYEYREDDPDTPDQWVLVIGKNPEEQKNYKLWYYMDSTDADLSELDLNNPDHIDLDEMSTMDDYDEIQLSQDIKCSTVTDKHGKSVSLITM